eukprot:scaffold273_cov242-Pinguiococcus_pyrenoidosus.AAC.1
MQQLCATLCRRSCSKAFPVAERRDSLLSVSSFVNASCDILLLLGLLLLPSFQHAILLAQLHRFAGRAPKAVWSHCHKGGIPDGVVFLPRTFLPVAVRLRKRRSAGPLPGADLSCMLRSRRFRH